MGIAASVAAAVWVAGLAAALVLGPPPSLGAMIAMALAGVASLTGRWVSLGAGLAAFATALVWVPAALNADAGGACALLAALVLLGMRRSALPGAVPWTLLAVGMVLAARGWMTASTLPAASTLAAPLSLVALVVAGATARPAVGRWGGAALLGCAGLGVVLVTSLEPADPSRGVDSAAHRRLAAALFALSEHPQDHDHANAIAEVWGLELPLNAGWVPAGADLSASRRVTVAWWLRGHGRGGEGRRLLAAARRDPDVTWTWVLFRRLEGLDDPEVDALTDLVVPAGVPRLPGLIPLNWMFHSNGSRTLTLHLDAPQTLALRTHGESWRGATRLQVSLDGAPPVMVSVPDGDGVVALPGPSRAGPHVLSVAFTEDIQGEGGDRNAKVRAVISPAPLEPDPALGSSLERSGAPASPQPH